jgi:general secretion pathway protein H
MRIQARSGGFTLIEILVVVLIIGIITAGVLLSVNLTGRDRELEHESERLAALVNYAHEQAELQTREYGVVFHDDSYQFVAYDARRGVWREVYEDDSLRLRRLPYGLNFKLSVEARPVVLTPTGEIKPANNDSKPKAQNLKDVKVQDTVRRTLGNDDSSTLKALKSVTPQVMIFSNGDLTSFEITMEREGSNRSIALTQDEKGAFVPKPLLEGRT